MLPPPLLLPQDHFLPCKSSMPALLCCCPPLFSDRACRMAVGISRPALQLRHSLAAPTPGVPPAVALVVAGVAAATAAAGTVPVLRLAALGSATAGCSSCSCCPLTEVASFAAARLVAATWAAAHLAAAA